MFEDNIQKEFSRIVFSPKLFLNIESIKFQLGSKLTISRRKGRYVGIGSCLQCIKRSERNGTMDAHISGIQNVHIIKEITPFTTGLEILERNEIKRHLRILSPTSKLPFEQGSYLQRLLDKGISLELLLLDPRVEASLYGSASQETENSQVSMISVMQIVANLNKASNRHINLRVKFHTHYVPEVLIFVDSDRLFLYSFLPYLSSSRFVYQIVPGEGSLYNLYNEAFHFLWNTSKEWPNPLAS